jgi:D-glycero-alpha-D-manno-heptose 1-phosphate guanylyltransferase
LAVSDAARFGTLETATDGRLIRFAEKRSGTGLINAGVYAFRAALLAEFPAKRPLSFEVEVFPQLLQQGCQLKVTTCRAPFIDIGTEASLPQTEAFIRDHHAEF